MKHKHLKRGLFTSPQSGESQFERYVIENKNDAKAFFKTFPNAKPFMAKDFEKYLAEGEILLATDENPMSGFPSYCFQSDKSNTHVCAFHRVQLLN